MRVLTPFDNSVWLGQQGLPTADYGFPEPKVLKEFGAQAIKTLTCEKGGKESEKDEATGEKEARRNRPTSPHKKTLYDSMLLSSSDLPNQRLASKNVWSRARILLSHTLGLKESQREAHEANTVLRGGVIVR